MKTRFTLILLALTALAVSCTKEIADETTSSGEKVTIRVSMPDELTSKVAFTEAADKQSMALSWEMIDNISVNGEKFTIKSGFTAHEAEFEGNAPSGDSYTIIYPGKYATKDAFDARSYTQQTQFGFAPTSHLEYNAALVGVSEYAEPKFDPEWAADKGGTLIQNAVVQLRLQLPAGAEDPTSVTLSASRAIFPTTNAGGTLVKEQTLALDDVTLPSNKILEAYMMVSAAGVEIRSGDELTVFVDTPGATYFRTISPEAQTWTGGGQYTLQLKVQNENIFRIYSTDDLMFFHDGVNSGDVRWQKVHAVLESNLDCRYIQDWTPIGNGTFTPAESGTVSATWTEPAFKGTFDGGNFTIQNLNMTGSPAEYAPYGLFGILYGATVKNLRLGEESGDIGALTVTPQGRMDAGALAGVAFGSVIENVINYYPINLADNTSSARACLGMVGYVYGDASSGKSVLSGLQNYGKVKAVKGANTANGATSFQVAGIAGFGNSGAADVVNEITGCTNYGDIEAETGRTAGILAAGNTRTALEGCVNRGNILNTFSNGRIAGICVILGSGTSMKDCSNYGDVIATQNNTQLGGLVCLVNNANVPVTGGGNHGRILGDITSYHGTVIANFNALSKADDIIAGGAYGTYNGGDYQYTVLTEDNYMSYIGRIASGNESKITNIHFEAWDGYPESNETLIANAADLQAFAAKVNAGNFAATDVAKLTADIDCSSITAWEPIGDYTMTAWTHVNLTGSGHPFLGTFDGQGHSIKNLHMSFTNSGSYKAFGFFGCIGDGATVKNLTFDASCSMTISASFGGAFGMLAGMVLGATVDNVKNYASLSGFATSSLANGANGRSSVGSLIGEVHPSSAAANISKLYNAGTIGASETSLFDAGPNIQTGANAVHVGGIVGFTTNIGNTTVVSLSECINDGDIFTNAGRTSGMVAAANRYTHLTNCTNNGDVYNAINITGSSRLANITCIAGAGSILDSCINTGDLIAPYSVSVAGVVCLVNDATVQLKNTGSHGATIIGKSVNVSGNQTYNGVLFGYCNFAATFTNCSVSGKIGTSADNLVTLTSENYFPYVGQATAKATNATAANITFYAE